MRLRVCVIGSGTFFLSGISYYTHRLAVSLNASHRVSVLLYRRLIPKRFYPGSSRVGKDLTALRYEGMPHFDGIDWFWGLSALRGLWFLVRQRPQAVVLQWWTGAVLHTHVLAAIVSKCLGSKVILEFHEVQDVGEVAAVRVAKPYVSGVFPVLLRLLDGVVVHNQHDLAAIETRYGALGIPIECAPHGPYDYLPQAVAHRPEPDADTCHLLFFGVIRPFKGLEDLIAAFDLMTESEASQFRLTIVGEIWEGHRLPIEMAVKSRHADRIHTINRYVSDVEVADYFSLADVVVLPYRRSSSSGPLHLTMSRGLPVVVTNVGGLTEAAADYEGAVRVPASDPISLKNALLDARLLKGRRFRDPHSWDATVASFDRLFVKVGVAPALEHGGAT